MSDNNQQNMRMFGQQMKNSHHVEQSQQGSSFFDRQDSFATIATLQQEDMQRNDSTSFLEEKMDIRQYLQAIEDHTGATIDSIDLDDSELQKSHILSHDQESANGDFFYGMSDDCDVATEQDYQFGAQPTYNQGQYEHDDNMYGSNTYVELQASNHCPVDEEVEERRQVEQHDEEEEVPKDQKRRTRIVRPTRRARPVDDDDDEDYVPTTSIKSKRVESVIDFTPDTTPRKYCPKDEKEKSKPEYRLKRERNNDAVRKSRSKAKVAQEKKDEELERLRTLNKKQEIMISSLKKELREKDDLIKKLTL